MTTPTNTPSQADIEAKVRDLGAQAGAGKDVQIKTDLTIIDAAYLGTLNLDEHKHGKDVDDAAHYAELYWKSQQGAVIFDASAPNQRKLISNIRKCIKLGSCPKWGVGEPMATVNALMNKRQNLRKQPAYKGKLDDAHNSLMRYATAQLKRDTLIDESELEAFCLKGECDATTAEDVLEAIRKKANALKAGKVAHCTDLDNSQEVQDIIRLCTKRLTAIAKARAPQGQQAPSTQPTP